MELIPGLPEELGLECLTRLPYTAHPTAAGVCQNWKLLLQSPQFYRHRSLSGKTHKLAVLVHSLPAPPPAPDGAKPPAPPPYALAVFSPSAGTFTRLDAVPAKGGLIPLFCRLVSVGRKLVVVGGWDPETWDPVSDVFVFDFVTRRWRRGRDMPSKRSFFAAGATADGRVLVAGGHDEGKNALSSCWGYDVERDEWAELARMSEERDECEGIVVGNEFWVVSGYGTERQGRFEASAEVYEAGTGRWRRVEGAWGSSRCPRGCVGVGSDGKLVCLAELGGEVRVGGYVVELGESTLFTGSASQGGPPLFYLVDRREGQNVKWTRVDVPKEFGGFVQSGCCLEI
ncbi:hypothetical protein Sjap_000830 [Stephania japonica]|uniref:F-box domain-containing protein n=1 Tax=Stephania japonica TaxID=461633 RepID=A0AAP0KJT5_9MAGN